MKHFSAVLLVLCLLLGLCSCKEAENTAGRFVCVKIEKDEEKIAPSGEFIQLNQKGKGAISLGMELEMKWELEGQTLTMETDFIENTYRAVYQDDLILLEADEQRYTFVLESKKQAWYEQEEALEAARLAEPIPVDPAAVGHYSCVRVYSDEKELLPEGKWLDLFDDGTAVVYFGMSMPGIWYHKDGVLTIELNNDEVYSGTLTEGLLCLTGELTYQLERTGQAGSAKTASDLATPTPLVAGSSWSGTMKVRRHTGRGQLHDGKFEVTARIYEENGATFFEVNDPDEPEAGPIVSMQVLLHKSNIEPLLGADAAKGRIFEQELDETMAFSLTMFLDSEYELEFYHGYKSSSEACDLYFSFTLAD